MGVIQGIQTGGGAEGTSSGTHAGDRDGARISISELLAEPGTRNSSGSTLIHEIGHAIDFGRGRERGHNKEYIDRNASVKLDVPEKAREEANKSSEWDRSWPINYETSVNPTGKGMTEGIADRYRDTKFVNDRRTLPLPDGKVSKYKESADTRLNPKDKESLLSVSKKISRKYLNQPPTLHNKMGLPASRQWAEGYAQGASGQVKPGETHPMIQGELF
jgi:hypothetical protein